MTSATFINEFGETMPAFFAPEFSLTGSPTIVIALVIVYQILSFPLHEGGSLRLIHMMIAHISIYNRICAVKQAILLPLFAIARFPLITTSVAELHSTTAGCCNISSRNR